MWQLFIFRGDNFEIRTFFSEHDAKKVLNQVGGDLLVISATLYGPGGFYSDYSRDRV